MKAGKSSKRMRESSPHAEVAAATQESVLATADRVVAVAAPGTTQDAIVLLPECTARNAEALRTALLERLDAPGKVDVEVGAVERVDTVSLQLLSAFVQERSRLGRTTAWRGRSDVLVQAVALLGLGGTLAVGDAA